MLSTSAAAAAARRSTPPGRAPEAAAPTAAVQGDRVAAAGSDVKYVVRWLGAPPVVVRAFAAYAHQHTVYDFTKDTQQAELTRTSQAIPPNLISTTTHQGSVIQLLLVNLLITCSKMVGRMGRAGNCELRSTRKLTGPCRYGYHQGD